MIIRTLVENTRPENRPELQAEFGLSLHISTDRQEILFDFGASGAFTRNAGRMDLDLGKVDLALLSHHHLDHGGGLRDFFSQNHQARVYLKSPPEGTCTFRALKLLKRSIDLDRSLFANHADRFVFTNEFTEIAQNIFVLSHISSDHPKPRGNRQLYLKMGTRFVHDPFEHELLLVIRSDKGLVVFTGCAHNGILNMLETVAQHFPDEPIAAVVGGFHLMGIPIFNSMAGPKSEVEELAKKLSEFRVRQLYTGHCTGQKAFTVMKRILGDQLQPLQTGSVIDVA